MIRFVLTLVILALPLAAQAKTQEQFYAERCLQSVEEDLAKARANAETPQWYDRVKSELSQLEEAITKLSPEERAPIAAKIAVWRPEIEAGVKLARGLRLARQIQDTLDFAREDQKRVKVDVSIFETLDRYFADDDAPNIPAKRMSELKAQLAELKKNNR